MVFFTMEAAYWVAGEIRELTNLRNTRNKNQEIREHIWEITEYFFRVNTSTK